MSRKKAAVEAIKARKAAERTARTTRTTEGTEKKGTSARKASSGLKGSTASKTSKPSKLPPPPNAPTSTGFVAAKRLEDATPEELARLRLTPDGRMFRPEAELAKPEGSGNEERAESSESPAAAGTAAAAAPLDSADWSARPHTPFRTRLLDQYARNSAARATLLDRFAEAEREEREGARKTERDPAPENDEPRQETPEPPQQSDTESVHAMTRNDRTARETIETIETIETNENYESPDARIEARDKAYDESAVDLDDFDYYPEDLARLISDGISDEENEEDDDTQEKEDDAPVVPVPTEAKAEPKAERKAAAKTESKSPAKASQPKNTPKNGVRTPAKPRAKKAVASASKTSETPKAPESVELPEAAQASAAEEAEQVDRLHTPAKPAKKVRDKSGRRAHGYADALRHAADVKAAARERIEVSLGKTIDEITDENDGDVAEIETVTPAPHFSSANAALDAYEAKEANEAIPVRMRETSVRLSRDGNLPEVERIDGRRAVLPRNRTGKALPRITPLYADDPAPVDVGRAYLYAVDERARALMDEDADRLMEEGFRDRYAVRTDRDGPSPVENCRRLEAETPAILDAEAAERRARREAEAARAGNEPLDDTPEGTLKGTREVEARAGRKTEPVGRFPFALLPGKRRVRVEKTSGTAFAAASRASSSGASAESSASHASKTPNVLFITTLVASTLAIGLAFTHPATQAAVRKTADILKSRVTAALASESATDRPHPAILVVDRGAVEERAALARLAASRPGPRESQETNAFASVDRAAVDRALEATAAEHRAIVLDRRLVLAAAPEFALGKTFLPETEDAPAAGLDATYEVLRRLGLEKTDPEALKRAVAEHWFPQTTKGGKAGAIGHASEPVPAAADSAKTLRELAALLLTERSESEASEACGDARLTPSSDAFEGSEAFPGFLSVK